MSRKKTPPTPAAPSAPADEPSDLEALFWETRFAERVGVAREKIAALRAAHLTTPAHYVMRGNAVVLTAHGIARLEDLLRVGPPPASAVPRTATAAQSPTAGPTPRGFHAPPLIDPPVLPGPPRREKLRVVKLCGNRHLLIACRADRAESTPSLLVRVRDNTLFLPRMVLEAVECSDGLWQHRGRLPRSRGRW